ncbi:hypothetical protein [Streptomyces sp. NPDC051665]|uniref:hypothetical protein n=1 Tax=Streptomyces sp. NPDC051665 TaxID=3154647 RepID=UPI00344137DA
MSEPVTAASALVRVEYHAFHLADIGQHRQPPFRPENGLIFSRPGLAVVLVGASSGVVNVQVQVYEQPVTSPDTTGWDEVVDHSIESVSGQMQVAAMMDDPPDLPLLTPFGFGHYRVRSTPAGVIADTTLSHSNRRRTTSCRSGRPHPRKTSSTSTPTSVGRTGAAAPRAHPNHPRLRQPRPPGSNKPEPGSSRRRPNPTTTDQPGAGHDGPPSHAKASPATAIEWVVRELMCVPVLVTASY